MTDREFLQKNRAISHEFSKYILARPDLETKIPLGAQVVFLLKNDPGFNEKSRKFAESQREKDQSVVYVTIKGITPVHASRLIEPRLEQVS